MLTRMRELRKARGMRQSDVADQLGVTRACYNFWETGRREPNLKNLCRLADLFRVTVDDLLGRNTEARQHPLQNRACEKELLDLMESAWDKFKECHPKGAHLTMFATVDGCCVMGYKPSAKGMERVVDGYLSPYGDYRFSGLEE